MSLASALPSAATVGNMAAMNDIDIDSLEDDIREALIQTGFMPIDYADQDFAEIELTERDAKVLGYFAERGWDTFRLDATGSWATLARWSEDGIELLSIDRNGVTEADARFSFSAQGAAWMAAAVQA